MRVRQGSHKEYIKRRMHVHQIPIEGNQWPHVDNLILLRQYRVQYRVQSLTDVLKHDSLAHPETPLQQIVEVATRLSNNQRPDLPLNELIRLSLRVDNQWVALAIFHYDGVLLANIIQREPIQNKFLHF